MPTGKMSEVVSAAKAMYDQLSSMGEDIIDGDSFLDLWIYVTLKANICRTGQMGEEKWV